VLLPALHLEMANFATEVAHRLELSAVTLAVLRRTAAVALGRIRTLRSEMTHNLAIVARLTTGAPTTASTANEAAAATASTTGAISRTFGKQANYQSTQHMRGGEMPPQVVKQAVQHIETKHVMS